MKYKQQLYIYDRREMFVFILLGLMISLFTFTLGIHYAKRLGSRITGLDLTDISPVSSVSDQIPNRQEFTEQSKGIQQTLDDLLGEELHSQVSQFQVRLDTPRQVDLPQAKKMPKSVKSFDKNIDKNVKAHYALQIGSYPTREEAQKEATRLQSLQDSSKQEASKNRSPQSNLNEVKPFLRETTIQGKKEKWCRIYLGSFLTKIAAEQAGNQFKSRHIIKSFIVSHLSD